MMKFMLILRKIKKDEWLEFFKNEAFCIAFSYARHSEVMQEIIGFGMKNCLSFSGLGGNILLL